MAGSSNQFPYFINGITNIVLASGATFHANPIAYENGGFLKVTSRGNSGVVELVNSGAASAGQGYPIGASEVIYFSGPCDFFLIASGNTVTVSFARFMSQGLSQPTPPY